MSKRGFTVHMEHFYGLVCHEVAPVESSVKMINSVPKYVVRRYIKFSRGNSNYDSQKLQVADLKTQSAADSEPCFTHNQIHIAVTYIFTALMQMWPKTRHVQSLARGPIAARGDILYSLQPLS